MTNSITRVAVLAGLLVGVAGVRSARAQSAGADVPRTGRLQGTIVDSTRTAPLRGAIVQLVRADGRASPRSTTTDGEGRFAIDSLLPGTWVAGVLHPRLDTLALEELAQRVEVQERGVTRMAMGVPSVFTLSRQLCGTASTDSSGYLIGRVRRADGERDGTAATIRVEWLELSVVDGRLDRQTSYVEAQAAPSGSYRVCGVPLNAATRVRAWSGRDSTGVVDQEFSSSGIVRLDLFLGRTTYVKQLIDSTASPDDSLATIVLRTGSGRLRGIITDALGKPVENVTVTVTGSGQSQRTTTSGAFELSALATGTQQLDARAIGFAPLRVPVDLLDGDTASRTFALATVTKLATVEVRAKRAKLMGQDMIDFEARRKRAAGRFFGPEDLIAIDPVSLGSLVQRLPGIKVVQNGQYGDRILMGGSGFSQYCSPDIWLDGYKVVNDGTMDSFLQPQLIRAVEVYNRPASVPPQFMSANLCGVIVLWSGPRDVPGVKRK